MDSLRIVGGKRLEGTVQVSGAKNAALPILVASLLSESDSSYTRVPDLQDIHFTALLLKELGCTVHFDSKNNSMKVRAPQKSGAFAPYDLVRKMRASILVLGPLLARYGETKVSLPGGCAIGARPVDLHLKGLEALGARIELENGYVLARCKKLKGARHRFEFPSVGATENVLMAAVLAEGETVLENCAREPEIVDLADALIARGARIEGQGASTLRIQGGSLLSDRTFPIVGDRIEAGTYLIAGLITRGSVKAQGIAPGSLTAVLEAMRRAGAEIETGEDWIRASIGKRARAHSIKTEPFPGFPTDMQAQWMSWMCFSEGRSQIEETIFENRFMHVPELARMGAKVKVDGHAATIDGVPELKGAPVMATDLRASASLVLAGLAAQGETTVNRIYHLDRGYEKLEAKLQGLGATVERLKND